jgi:D-2-hydroxyglutarate dehydrogenase
MRRAKRDLAEILSAFEFLDRASLDLVNAQLKGTKDPLPETPAPFYVVIETSSSTAAGTNERARLDTYLAALKQEGIATAGVVGKNPKHASALWNLRGGAVQVLNSVDP